MIGGKHPAPAAPVVRHAAPAPAAPAAITAPAAPAAVSGRAAPTGSAAPGMLGGKHRLARTLAARRAEVIAAP